MCRSSNIRYPCVYWYVSEDEEEWKVIKGKFLAINIVNMSCACPRSPKGLSPAAHLADGSADLILVRKCSRFDFLRYLVRHTNQHDQVCIPFGSELSRISFKVWMLIFIHDKKEYLQNILKKKKKSLCILYDLIWICVPSQKSHKLNQVLGRSILTKFHLC